MKIRRGGKGHASDQPGKYRAESDGLGLFHHPSGVKLAHPSTVDRISHDPEGLELQGN
jgi:hypothetical protein